MKVLFTFGTRPEAIKLAPVIQEAESRGDDLTTRVCVTGQHRSMLDQVVDLFELPVHHDLDVMVTNQSPTQVAAAILARMNDVLRAEAPDWVVVQGDTTSAAATALAAFYGGHKVAHVEAGLRTGLRRSPFPEEMNRRVVTPLADLHCAPTERARYSLLAEGVDHEQVIVTGNTVVDALLWSCRRPHTPKYLELARRWNLGVGDRSAEGPRVLLVTAHRRENFGAPLVRICSALAEIAHRYGDAIRIVYPVHPNPNVQTLVHEMLDGVPSISLVEPLDYVTQCQLMARSWLILTDSGGIQEEAPSLRVPVLILRDSTERPEVLSCGAAKLVGTSTVAILTEVERLWADDRAHRQMAVHRNPFGDGRSSARVIQALLGECVEPMGQPHLAEPVLSH